MPNAAQAGSDTAHMLRQLYIFMVLSGLGTTMYGAYYSIFLYNHTLDLKILIIDNLVAALTGWTGYLIGTFVIHRSGYGRAMRLSFLSAMVCAEATWLLVAHVSEVYVLLALLRGLSGGIYTAVVAAYLLKEVRKHDRSDYYFLSMALSLCIGIVMPVAIGAIVSYFGGFKVTFLLAAGLSAIGVVLPLGHNRRPRSEVSLGGIVGLTRTPHFKEYALNRVLVDGADQLNAFLLAIVPFLIVKSVFGVGVISSIIGVAAAAAAYISRRYKLRRQIELGYIGGFGRILGNLLLVGSWSAVGLVIRGLAVQLLSVFTDPIANKINISNLEKLLGDEAGNKTLEVDLLNATLTLGGQACALSLFLLFLTTTHLTNRGALQTILVIYPLWKLASYLWIQQLNRRLRRRTARPPLAPLAPLPPLPPLPRAA